MLENYHQGKRLTDEMMLDKGSVVDLVVGKGLSDEKTNVPNLFGKQLDDAKNELFDLSLNVGVLIYDDSFENAEDSLNAKIWKASSCCWCGAKN